MHTMCLSIFGRSRWVYEKLSEGGVPYPWVEDGVFLITAWGRVLHNPQCSTYKNQ